MGKERVWGWGWGWGWVAAICYIIFILESVDEMGDGGCGDAVMWGWGWGCSEE